MPKKGTFTVYQQSTKSDVNFRDLIKDQQEYDIAERDAQIREANAELLQRQQQNKENEAFDAKYAISDKAVLKTGFNNYDEMMLPYAQSIKDELWNTREALKADPKNIELQKKFSNLTGTVNTIQASNDVFTKILEKYSKLEDEGGISGVHADKYMDLLQKYSQYKVIPVINKETGLTDMIYEDENGDRQSINLQEMIDGEIDIYGKQDVGKLAGKVADSLGVRIKDEATGRFINTEVVFDDDLKSVAKNQIKAMMATDDNLADILNQANGSNVEKWDTSTPEGKAQREKDVQTAVDYMIEQVEASYDTKDTLKERSYPPVSRVPRTSATERREEERAIARNQTLANARNGEVSSLINRPAHSVDENGKRISVVIDDAKVVADELILGLSNGEEVIVDMNNKKALNEVFNTATGVAVDSDKIGILKDVTPTAEGARFEDTSKQTFDSVMEEIDAKFVNRTESIVVPELQSKLDKYGIIAEESGMGSYVTLSLASEQGLLDDQKATIEVSLNNRKKENNLKAVAQIKEFISKYGTVPREFKELEKDDMSKYNPK